MAQKRRTFTVKIRRTHYGALLRSNKGGGFDKAQGTGMGHTLKAFILALEAITQLIIF